MLLFSQAADRIAATTKKLEKTTILADYFKSVPVEEAAVAAVFFSGHPFPVWKETTLQVGGTLLWRVVTELSGKSEVELTAAYREHGDLGDVAEAVLPQTPDPHRSGTARSPSQIHKVFREIASTRRPAMKAAVVRELLSGVSPLEAKYIIKIMTGDLRIGLKESLVEEAIAKAFAERQAAASLKAVQRANMLLGDLGETLKLAAEGTLAHAKMRMFHPIGFMLASPAESADDALSYFQSAWVEDKYDGIRAQAHCSGETVRLFSRTRDEITESFPELPDALAGLPHDTILDGEIVAWSYFAGEEPSEIEVERRAPPPVEGNTRGGRALPFTALQKRLGREKISEKLLGEVPVAYLVFDVLYANGELLIDLPLRERGKILEDLLARRKPVHHRGTETQGRRGRTEIQGLLDFRSMPAESQEPIADCGLATTDDLRHTMIPPTTDDERPTALLRTTYDGRRTSVLPTTNDQRPPTGFIRAPVSHATSPEELNMLFDAAQARGNEGLMIKDPESPYTPGRRGKSWLKLKRELATLDVVVTAVEYGHGRRIGVLSDYTFAVRDGERLLNVGKAYSGLTDAEIVEMTTWFLDHTIEDQGFRRTVEPKIVLEVAFNNVMKSDRHNSGYALRFPRIVRLRPDKLPEQIDTLARVKEIYERQSGELQVRKI